MSTKLQVKCVKYNLWLTHNNILFLKPPESKSHTKLIWQGELRHPTFFWEAKCEVTNKTLHYTSDGSYKTVFVSKVRHITGPEPRRKRGGPEARARTVPYKAQAWLAWHNYFMSARLVSTFNLRFTLWSYMGALASSVS